MNNIKKYLAILFISCAMLMMPFFAHCQQQQFDSLQISRIADFGKVWGVINYFHPEIGKGTLNADSLLIDNSTELLQNPTTENFKQALSHLFTQLKDSRTQIITPAPQPVNGLFPLTFTSHPVAQNQIYVALPQTMFDKEVRMDSIFRKQEYKKSYIVDLRSGRIDTDLGLNQYANVVQPLIANLIQQTMVLPTERNFYYKGLMREDFPHDFNILTPDSDGNFEEVQVHNGFRNVSLGSYLMPAKNRNWLARNKYCFIVNQNTNINIVKAVMALRNRHLCRVIFDGEMPDYLFGRFYKMRLADGITAKIRTSELIYEDGTLGDLPDLALKSAAGPIPTAGLISQAAKLLGSNVWLSGKKQIENTVMIRRPANAYSTVGVPEARLRLLGLFNFWNAFYYFSPNKDLTKFNWSTALTHFVPRFLAAKTDSTYFMALMELTASVNDGHSGVFSRQTGRSPVGVVDGNLPIIVDPLDGKVYITGILPDTTQKGLSRLQPGDQVIAVDQVPVKNLRAFWKQYLSASNEAGFNREYYATWFATGAVGSKAMLTILRKGQTVEIPLKRIKRDNYYMLRGKVVRKPEVPPLYPPYCKVLDGNIGYLRMNKVYTKQLDSLSTMLKGCNSIIIDARGYPRDYQIGGVLASYIATKTDTVAVNEFPYVTGPNVQENAVMVNYEVIRPNANSNLKNKSYYILVDEGDQSQGEGNVIALQGVTNATTIGTTTAGANGMAVTVNLPDNYFTFFSGFGEFYPDHTPNQKLGVKIDHYVNHTITGLIQGQDEVMASALSYIKDKNLLKKGSQNKSSRPR